MFASPGPAYVTGQMSRKALKYALKYGTVSSAHPSLVLVPDASYSRVIWSKGGYGSPSLPAFAAPSGPAPSQSRASQPASRIQGLWPACLVPTHADGSVDLPKILGHVQHLLRVGCDGVTLFGTCGEGASFSVAERKQVLEYVVRAGVQSNRLLVATYACALPDAVDLTRHATALGVFGVMFIPPFYFNAPTDDGVVQATCELIKRVADHRLRIVLYHIPSVTGVAFTEAAVAEIIQRYPQHIIGLKDSSGDQQHSMRFIKRFPSIGIVIGNELQIPKLMPEGATGSVCGAGNISPNLVLRIIRNPQNVDKTDWAALNALGGLVWDAGAPFFLGVYKTIMAEQTKDASWLNCRLPQTPMSDADRAVLLKKYKAIEAQYGHLF